MFKNEENLALNFTTQKVPFSLFDNFLIFILLKKIVLSNMKVESSEKYLHL